MPESRTLELLRDLDEFKRYELFLDYYRSPDPLERKALEEALEGGEVLLKLLLLQYLQGIPESAALSLALPRLEDDNEVVREAASAVYARNAYTRKNRLLRPYVFSRKVEAACFSVRSLSRQGDSDILPALLARLEDAEASLRGEILRALARLPDPRAVPLLERAARDAPEDARCSALRALAEIKGAGFRVAESAFLAHAGDPSPRVRRAALDGLRLYSSRRMARLLLEKALAKGEAEESRRRAISALAAFPSPRLVEPLLALTAENARGILRLAAEIALRRFPAPMLRDGLMALARRKEGPLRQRAAVLLAETSGSEPSVRRFLMGLWEEAEGVQEKIAAMEILGELGGAEAMASLLSQARASPVLAYVAVGVLDRLWRFGSGERMLAILEDPATPDLVRQSVLGALLKRELEPSALERLFPRLCLGVRSEVVNVRYLSLRLLERYPLERSLEPLVGLLVRESDPEAERTARAVLARGLGGDPRPLLGAALKLAAEEALPARLFGLLELGAFEPAHARELLAALAAEPLRLAERDPEGFARLCAALVERSSLGLEQAWELVPDEERRLHFLGLLREAGRGERARLPELPLEFLRSRLGGGPASARALLYGLMGASRQEHALGLLTACLVREEDPAALEEGQEALGRLIREAPVPESAP